MPMSKRARNLLERLLAVLHSDLRAAAGRADLYPIHLEILGYLSRCNRYSDTATALVSYLGVTKGTLSKSLKLLEGRGLIEAVPDGDDRRKRRLRLTPAGAALRRDLAADRPGVAAGGAALEAALEQALRDLQRAAGGKTFGECRTCRHFEVAGRRFRCGLTGEALTADDSRRICLEHAAAG